MVQDNEFLCGVCHCPSFSIKFFLQKQFASSSLTSLRADHPAECKIDLVFLMDGSWSIGKRRFKIQKDFLAEVAQAINVGPTGPMMGVVQYG